MSKNNNRNIMSHLLLAFGLLASTAGFAWHQHHGGGWYEGHQHYHGYDDYYNRGWSYGGGGFYFGAGDWGGGPNVVINAPPPTYYAPACQSIEVCNSYGDCWLEPACD